jgi:hypothetical protein
MSTVDLDQIIKQIEAGDAESLKNLDIETLKALGDKIGIGQFRRMIRQVRTKNPTFPNLFQQLKNAAMAAREAAGGVAKNCTLFASNEVADERRLICVACEHRAKRRCSKCGCNVRIKTRLQTSKCPDNRWEK